MLLLFHFFKLSQFLQVVLLDLVTSVVWFFDQKLGVLRLFLVLVCLLKQPLSLSQFNLFILKLNLVQVFLVLFLQSFI